MKRAFKYFLACLILLFNHILLAKSTFTSDNAEEQLITIINDIKISNIDSALISTQALIKKHPKFRLARLVYADLLSGQAGNKIQYNPEYNFLYQEALARIKGKHHAKNIKNKTPRSIISLPDTIPYLLQFDMSESRMYLIKNKNQQLSVIDDHYISIGKAGFNKQNEGDNKSPIGVYKVTSFLEDEKIPELYGWGAFPINYPNTLDRLEGRAGHGIWLHGIPRINYSRPPKDSEGCVVLNNESLKNLMHFIEYQKTPVILSSSIKWQTAPESLERQLKFEQLFDRWRSSWQNQKTTEYANFYSLDFDNKKKRHKEWVDKKTLVIKNSTNIKINISDLSIYQYPDRENIIYMRFYQHYHSDQFDGGTWKEQYWKKESDGNWRITFEG